MSLITEALRSQIGKETAPYQLRVEAQDLVRFATMLGYTDAFYVDERQARHSAFGSLIAVPTYLIVMRRLEHAAFADIGIGPPLPNGVDGGSSWHYFEPIRPGDVISGRAKVTGLKERQTTVGETLFQTIEINYVNHFDELVVSQHDTRIFYQ
jgi:acyl dehydratase